MAKKEFKVGETFQCGLVKLKVEKDSLDCCHGCYFYDLCDCKWVNDNITGSCIKPEREDGNDVIFVKVEE